MQLPGASDASTWANSRLRPEDSSGAGFNASVSADAHASGNGASCHAGGANALWDDRGRAGLLSSGATGSTTGLQASLHTPRGLSVAEPACATGGRPGDAPLQQQQLDAQRRAGEPGAPLAMLSDTVLAGYYWEYQPQALNADGAPAHDEFCRHHASAVLTVAPEISLPQLDRVYISDGLYEKRLNC